MRVIFVVKGSQGEYSDRMEWPILSFAEKEQAAQFVKHLIELQKFNEEFYLRQEKEFHNTYQDTVLEELESSCPRVPDLPYLFKHYERICWNGRGSDSEREKMKALQKEHLVNLDAYEKKRREYNEALAIRADIKEKARAEWFERTYIVPIHLELAAQVIGFKAARYESFDVEYSYYSVNLVE